MGVFSKLLGAFARASEAQPAQSGEKALEHPTQALIVNFDYGLPSDDPFFELDEVLHEAFLNAAPAEYDGHEIAMDNSDGTFFFYGPSADELLRLAAPLLLKYPFMKGAKCLRRYGKADDDNALEVTTELGRLPS
jgi:hypothetical protein